MIASGSRTSPDQPARKKCKTAYAELQQSQAGRQHDISEGEAFEANSTSSSSLGVSHQHAPALMVTATTAQMSALTTAHLNRFVSDIHNLAQQGVIINVSQLLTADFADNMRFALGKYVHANAITREPTSVFTEWDPQTIIQRLKEEMDTTLATTDGANISPNEALINMHGYIKKTRRSDPNKFRFIRDNDAYTLKQLFADFRKRLPAKREEQLMQALTSEERQAMLLLFFKLFVDPNWSQYFELMRRTKALFVQTNNSSATTSKYVKNEIYFIVDMLNFWRDEFYVIGQQYDSIVSWLPTSIIVPKQLLPGNSGQGAVRGQGGQSGGNGQNGRNNNKARITPTPDSTMLCNKCGRNKHLTEACDYMAWSAKDKEHVKLMHSYINHEDCPFASSKRGKACLAKFGVSRIPHVDWVASGLSKDDWYAQCEAKKKQKKCKCTTCTDTHLIREQVFAITGMEAEKSAPLLTIHAQTSSTANVNVMSPNTFPINFYGQNGKSIETIAMLDQGAPHGSYMSHEFAAAVSKMGGRRIACNKRVCGGVGIDRCEDSSTCLSVTAGILPNAIYNTLTKEMTISFETTAINCPHAVIIGKPVMIQYNLYNVMRPLLMRPAPPNTGETIYTYMQPGEYLTDQAIATETVAQESSNGLPSAYKPYGFGALTSDAMLNLTPSAEGGGQLASGPFRSLANSTAEGPYYIQGPGSQYLRDSISKADLGEEIHTRIPMTNEATWPSQPEDPNGNGEVRSWMTADELRQLAIEHPTLPTKYWGTAEERRQQVMLCAEFSFLFRTELLTEPADIPPMIINIDAEGWTRARGNALPARAMNQEKQGAAIDIMTEQQRLNIVEHVNVSAWSQMSIIWKKVKDLITGKVHDTHVSRLNEYLFDENDISFTPHDAARRDNHELWVEAILDHKGHQRD